MEIYEEDRPPIPDPIRREIEVEAGHKCSITHCTEHTYLEIHQYQSESARQPETEFDIAL